MSRTVEVSGAELPKVAESMTVDGLPPEELEKFATGATWGTLRHMDGLRPLCCSLCLLAASGCGGSAPEERSAAADCVSATVDVVSPYCNGYYVSGISVYGEDGALLSRDEMELDTARGRIVVVSDRFAGDAESFYDAGGNEVERTLFDTDGRPIVTYEYEHDGAGYLLEGSGVLFRRREVSEYRYERPGALTELVTTEQGGYTVVFELDDLDRKVAATRTDASGASVEARYRYDSAGRLSRRVIGARTTTYFHDEVGNVVRIESAGEDGGVDLVQEYEYSRSAVPIFNRVLLDQATSF